MIKRVPLFLAALCFVQMLLAQPSLPIAQKEEVKPLTELHSEKLRKLLKSELCNNPTWKKLINNKKMTVGLVDLSDLDNVRYAGLNDDHMMYAASLPKIAILLAAMDAMEDGTLKETPEVIEDLTLMIRKSNNQASTRMIDRLGYDRIESTLRNPKYKLYDEEEGGGLWVGKRYAAGGLRHPEPMKGLSHAATTRQVSNFYYMLAMGELVSKERSEQMLDIMVDPGLHHKFVNTLDRIAPKAKLYRKSGSWRNYHSDSALVWGPNRRYIIVVLVDDAYGEQIMRRVVRPLENVIKKSHQL
ncbi:serine hydrolase [Zeaxanthinibacter sp. PT1]|uniref:serine hydrolase n=1 Tax=Zeaxanthinibacter TaxID=561554 RepID=UPI00234B78D6|nr:serine hydrolase [Zeaxanthinibacter sp. PT1]MDC6351493.1 serine hydrolase [Zeaxanthinibacter sp. PT1]